MLPAKAYMGGTASVGVNWKGLAVGKRYLGAVRYAAEGVPQGSSVVLVETNDPLPPGNSVSRNSPANAGI
ncbi:hypothetical protein [Chitinimonas arctica]|uniref:hypothetical protein n=1 Tax=Chitinimonas arctica TaxID=2594795 RepID=UPI0015D25411|nr:hypothetical protein [Chitinimonas arctica]